MNDKKQDEIIFNEREKILQKNTSTVQLNEYAARCLSILIKNEGSTVSKEKIHEVCWLNTGVYVSEASIRKVINQLRNAITAVGSDSNIIVTIPRHGYSLRDKITVQKLKVSNSCKKNNDESDSYRSVPFLNELSKRLSHFKKLITYFAISLIIILAISTYKNNFYIIPIDYTFIKEVNGVRFFSQDNGINADEIQDIADRLSTFKIERSDDYNYIYINKRFENQYLSAFMCRAPIDQPDSSCTSLLSISEKHD